MKLIFVIPLGASTKELEDGPAGHKDDPAEEWEESSTEVADDLAVGLHLFTVEFASKVYRPLSLLSSRYVHNIFDTYMVTTLTFDCGHSGYYISTELYSG